MSSAVASATTNWLLHYEQLRNDALSPAAGRSPAPGLALFLRKGMIAWMRAWSCLPNPAAEVLPPPAATSSCPQDIRAQLAVLLAGLILGQQLEAAT
ncbi:MAG: hypothetical protein IT367_08555 [Candidatus Hydrogenedentes bacterium]|nr:hypothetical protein [Candidatus Hydrogenedentota bacterium]